MHNIDHGNFFDSIFSAFQLFIELAFVVFFLNIDNEDWGGMCAAGKRQSPVDLNHDAAIKGQYPGFIFQNYDKAVDSPQIINNGHSSKFQLFIKLKSS